VLEERLQPAECYIIKSLWVQGCPNFCVVTVYASCVICSWSITDASILGEPTVFFIQIGQCPVLVALNFLAINLYNFRTSSAHFSLISSKHWDHPLSPLGDVHIPMKVMRYYLVAGRNVDGGSSLPWPWPRPRSFGCRTSDCSCLQDIAGCRGFSSFFLLFLLDCFVRWPI
jgi:hypothetical protein